MVVRHINRSIMIYYIITDDIVTPQERDTGLMNALVASGTVRAAFVGHNHGTYCYNFF